MIEFANGGQLVESISELPDLKNSKTLFADFETTSQDAKEKSTNPHFHCEALGIAIKRPDSRAYYIPIRHEQYDLDIATIHDWWFETISTCDEWINHNLKYDAHVSANSCGVLMGRDMRMVDTAVLAKLLDSDRFRYALDVLSEDWLGEDISWAEKALKRYLTHTKDYGVVPADVMAEYACQDVITNQRLYKYIRDLIPSEVWEGVAQTEIALTTILFHCEREGIRVTPDLNKHEFVMLHQMLEIDKKLEELVGRPFRPDHPGDCYDVLCNQYGLPVVETTDSGNPSFDKTAMAAYEAHVDAPAEVVDNIIKYRKLNTVMNFFVKPYRNLKDKDDIMHTDFDQIKRTGRMGAKQPNVQQLNKEAKKLIVPRDGEAFLSVDYSQIEFRLIIHYIKNQMGIQAYKEDPDADFHSLVAEWCQISRKPAKTVNFMIAFGGGKRKTVASLAANRELVGPFRERAEEHVQEWMKVNPDHPMYAKFVGEVFQTYAEEKGLEVYNKYHNTLPELKQVSRVAAGVAHNRGYVKNLYGRRRHLPQKISHIAFNTLNQGSAADLIKERTVALAPILEGTPIRMTVFVHDSILFTGPEEAIYDDRTVNDIVSVMEHPSCEDILRVPIRCTYGRSRESWFDADDDDNNPDAGLRIPYGYNSQLLGHLR